MNKRELVKSLLRGAGVRVRPRTRKMTDAGDGGLSEDHQWRYVRDPTTTKGVRLENISTGHIWLFAWDNIREFRNPDFLILRGQLTLNGNKVEFEPSLHTQRGEPLGVRATGAVLSGGQCEVRRPGCDAKVPGTGIISQVNVGTAQVVSVCHHCLEAQLSCGDWYEEGH